MITSRTPHRISFFGGGTDYPIYYLKHGGKVLGAAIDKYCYLNVRRLPPFFNHKHRIVYSRQELVNQLGDIEHPSVRTTLKHLEVEYGVSVIHDGDIPARSGMGSSSSFTVGLLNAVKALEGERVSPSWLRDKAIHIEQNLIPEYVGSQDQTFAAYGGLNVIEFSEANQITVSPVILSQERLAEFQSHLLLFYSGLSRFASEIAKDHIERTEVNLLTLHEMKSLVDEGLNILSRGNLTDFGRLLDANWDLKRSLTQKVSTPEVDDFYQRAKNAGALGGKLLGAGGGGFVLLFSKPENRKRLIETLSDFLYVPFSFDFTGSKIVVYRPESQNGNGSP